MGLASDSCTNRSTDWRRGLKKRTGSVLHKLEEPVGGLPGSVHWNRVAVDRVIVSLHVLHQPLGQLLRRKICGIKHIDEAPLGEQPGSRPLLRAWSAARHDQGFLVQEQNLGQRVVT